MSKELRCPYCNDLITENHVEDMGDIIRNEYITESEYLYICPECEKESYIDIYKIDVKDNEIIDMVADIGKVGEICLH